MPGCKLYFYLTTTSTPSPVYTTSERNVTHSQPIEADAGGRFDTVYLDPAITYKATVTDANDVLLYTIDPVNDQAFDTDAIGRLLYPLTDEEDDADVTPVDFAHEPMSNTPASVGRYDPDEQVRNAADTLAIFGNPRTKPSGYTFTTGTIFDCAGPGKATHDFDAEQNFMDTYRLQSGGPSGQVWVDGVNGSDSNTGSLNDPFKTIAPAMAVSGVAIIWLMPGVYTDRFDVRATHATVSSGTQARAVRIKAWAGPGTVIYRAPGQQPGEMTWLQTPAASTYEATPSGSQTALHIVYHDNGKEIQIPWKSSAANANAVASGWFQDAGTKKIYIRHQNVNLSLSGVCDRFEIMYTAGNEQIVFGAKVYLEGITFRGSDQFTALTQTDSGNTYRPVVYARYCKWQYLAYHNFSSLGALTLLQDCVSEYSMGGDGYNYTADSGFECEATEVDCIGRYNGVLEYSLFDGDRNKQGSSGHNAAAILRVNGKYHGNYGQNIADTGTGSKTWMVGTDCMNPYADLAFTGVGAYYPLWTEGTAYLDSIKSGGKGSTHGLWVESGTAHLFRPELYGTTAPIGVNTGVTALYNPLSI